MLIFIFLMFFEVDKPCSMFLWLYPLFFKWSRSSLRRFCVLSSFEQIHLTRNDWLYEILPALFIITTISLFIFMIRIQFKRLGTRGYSHKNIEQGLSTSKAISIDQLAEYKVRQSIERQRLCIHIILTLVVSYTSSVYNRPDYTVEYMQCWQFWKTSRISC
jgi:hypothetical protein